MATGTTRSLHLNKHLLALQHVPHPGLHELGASAADMAQHLVQPTAPSHHSHVKVLITWVGLGKVTG
jgi:hypothetical protein